MVGCDRVIFHRFSNDTATIRFATDTPSAEGLQVFDLLGYHAPLAGASSLGLLRTPFQPRYDGANETGDTAQHVQKTN